MQLDGADSGASVRKSSRKSAAALAVRETDRLLSISTADGRHVRRQAPAICAPITVGSCTRSS